MTKVKKLINLVLVNVIFSTLLNYSVVGEPKPKPNPWALVSNSLVEPIKSSDEKFVEEQRKRLSIIEIKPMFEPRYQNFEIKPNIKPQIPSVPVVPTKVAVLKSGILSQNRSPMETTKEIPLMLPQTLEEVEWLETIQRNDRNTLPLASSNVNKFRKRGRGFPKMNVEAAADSNSDLMDNELDQLESTEGTASLSFSAGNTGAESDEALEPLPSLIKGNNPPESGDGGGGLNSIMGMNSLDTNGVDEESVGTEVDDDSNMNVALDISHPTARKLCQKLTDADGKFRRSYLLAPIYQYAPAIERGFPLVAPTFTPDCLKWRLRQCNGIPKFPMMQPCTYWAPMLMKTRECIESPKSSEVYVNYRPSGYNETYCPCKWPCVPYFDAIQRCRTNESIHLTDYYDKFDIHGRPEHPLQIPHFKAMQLCRGMKTFLNQRSPVQIDSIPIRIQSISGQSDSSNDCTSWRFIPCNAPHRNDTNLPKPPPVNDSNLEPQGPLPNDNTQPPENDNTKPPENDSIQLPENDNTQPPENENTKPPENENTQPPDPPENENTQPPDPPNDNTKPLNPPTDNDPSDGTTTTAAPPKLVTTEKIKGRWIQTQPLAKAPKRRKRDVDEDKKLDKEEDVKDDDKNITPIDSTKEDEKLSSPDEPQKDIGDNVTKEDTKEVEEDDEKTASPTDPTKDDENVDSPDEPQKEDIEDNVTKEDKTDVEEDDEKTVSPTDSTTDDEKVDSPDEPQKEEVGDEETKKDVEDEDKIVPPSDPTKDDEIIDDDSPTDEPQKEETGDKDEEDGDQSSKNDLNKNTAPFEESSLPPRCDIWVKVEDKKCKPETPVERKSSTLAKNGGNGRGLINSISQCPGGWPCFLAKKRSKRSPKKQPVKKGGKGKTLRDDRPPPPSSKLKLKGRGIDIEYGGAWDISKMEKGPGCNCDWPCLPFFDPINKCYNEEGELLVDSSGQNIVLPRRFSRTQKQLVQCLSYLEKDDIDCNIKK